MKGVIYVRVPRCAYFFTRLPLSNPNSKLIDRQTPTGAWELVNEVAML